MGDQNYGVESVKALVPMAVAITTVGIVDVMAIAVLGGFKDTGLVNNTTTDKFITGLAVFGTYLFSCVLLGVQSSASL